MSQFAFLQAEFAEVYGLARKAETLALADPRSACFHARLALESAVNWMYGNDRSLRSPYDTALSALIHESTFREVVGNALVTKARIIKDLGNRAVHEARAVPSQNAITCVRELFHFSYWLVRTYARGPKPDAALAFDPEALPRAVQVEAATLARLQALAKDRDTASRQLAEAQAARIRSEADRATLDAQVKALQAEVASIKAANAQTADTHDYNEAETRDAFIDLLLKEAGWPLDQKRDIEFPVKGMPNSAGEGFVDYVLWGDNGRPLAVVEAKRTRADPQVGQQQAKLYADCLETEFGVRPLIFYTNGYEHWLWDDGRYPPRQIQGFLTRSELELWRQRRDSRKSLSSVKLDTTIVERFYQARAIRRVGEAFEKDRLRRALLVMATGSGKTRTVIALVDQMMRANWVRRVLFLADRVALVRQAHNAFKAHLPSAPSANLIEQHDPSKNDHAGARICLATYPTMMNLVDEMQNGVRKYGVGSFDLVIVDEAHRSVYRKYGALFSYFDSLLVGLTATPRAEVDRDTYELFHLEKGVPTDAYDLEDAVKDGFLAPPKAISVPLKFPREGIDYDKLKPDEQELWDELEWEGKLPADDVSSAALNTWLFNADTVDKVLEYLMTHGLKVDEGDRIGKSIIFAKNHDHAQFIAQQFDANYPHLAGQFARVIDFKTEYVQSLIDDFSKPDSLPQIAISVDMLDTGIDVPEVLNLLFFKRVRSRTKFWQMIGRGTRLRPDLFGPGKHKDHFLVFDFCENFEFFNQGLPIAEGVIGRPLSEKLFSARVEITCTIEGLPDADRTEDLERLSSDIRERLKAEVAAIPADNFLARAKRRAVEHFQKKEAWATLSSADKESLITEIAGLPTGHLDDDLAAKQFDLVLLGGQLAVLHSDPAVQTCKEKVIALAERLQSLESIPMVKAEMALIEAVLTEEYWQDIDAWALELLRRRLRGLIKLIPAGERTLVYTNFEDQIGHGQTIGLSELDIGLDKARFQLKVRQFLTGHADHITILKLRRNEQLTPQDLAELERVLEEEGATEGEALSTLPDGGLGLFIRSIVGMEQGAAKDAFGGFIGGRNLSSNQIEFINLIIDHLIERGSVDARRLYESPFTDISDGGVSGVFSEAEVREIFSVLSEVKKRAAA
jgi:type I restriction enzyme R subunit